jgi:hypothetical protein
MRIDATRKCETILGIENLLGVLNLNFGSETSDLSILDRNVETIDRSLVRTHYAGVLNHGIEKLVHARHSFAYWRPLHVAFNGRRCSLLARRRPQTA